MKKYFIALLFLCFSCNTTEKKDIQIEPQVEMDSIIVSSQKNLESADLIQKKSDSITKVKVSVIVKQVEKYKFEKLMLMNQIKSVKANTIVRIDTVFIETKRNFWGREKKSVTVKSDASQTEFLDSSSLEEVIDTTKNQ